MKPNVIFLLLLFFSCKDANNNAGANNTQPKSASTTGIANESYKIDADGLLKDFMSWYNYTYYNVRLVQDFIAEDVHSNQISKRAFLQALTSGGSSLSKPPKETTFLFTSYLRPEVYNLILRIRWFKWLKLRWHLRTWKAKSCRPILLQT